MYNLSFLREFGLSDIQIKIYKYLLDNQFGNIDVIKSILNYSYAQVRENLENLERFGLISSSDGKPKLYFRNNPKVAIENVLKKKNEYYRKNIEKLNENIQAKESTKGVCTRNITFYHHSDINVGLDYMFELIEKAEKEIILSSLPPSLLKKLERALNRAFLNGIDIKLYYSNLDFDFIENYFGLITDIAIRHKRDQAESLRIVSEVQRRLDALYHHGPTAAMKIFYILNCFANIFRCCRHGIRSELRSIV